MTLVYLDPSCLLPHERNLRTNVGDVADLVASIEAVGILQPLVVLPVDDQPETYRIVIGHRRHQAALTLGLTAVPCLVATSEDDAHLIVSMLGENTARVGLTPVEVANAYTQLALLDWTPERIAKVTAQPAARVRGALALATLPEQARQAADEGSLTLEHAAELEEFATDPSALARILKRGGGAGWTFQHAIAEERRRRDRKTAVDRVKAELLLAGVRTIPTPKQWGWGATREVRAADLVDTEGQPLDPETMKTRPGFAAIVTPNAAGGPGAEIVCVDPEAWGYARPADSTFVSDTDRADRARREAETQAHREALDVAAGVRQAFLVQTYGTARGAKKAYPEALRVAVADPARLRFTDDQAELAARLAGVALLPAAATAGIDRLTRMLVARWVCGHESHLARIVAGQTWDVVPEAAAAYLGQLVAAGYELSDAETRLRAELVQAADDGDGDGENDPAGDADGSGGDHAENSTAEHDSTGKLDSDATEAAL
ncbi:MAG: ParB/RepB/Spo0J family partition protein [Micromonosporaceae bacterium]|nr:ParB/RepB/Spo0J family partition protein [Micromonosporaceae bacterium]